MKNQKTTKISIVIPVYNQERYLAHCLDSILVQTMSDFEVICINDGSTDGSGIVLDHYMVKDSRLRVVHRDNMGVGPTRNEGIAMAQGEFIAFMDPDDYYPNDKVLENLYSAATKHGAQICGGSLLVYDEENSNLVEKKMFPDRFDEDGFLDFYQFQFDYGFQRYLFNRQMLVENDIYFPNYKRFQDPPFFVRAMIAAERFYRITPATYVYRWSKRFSNWDDERVLHLVSAIRDNLAIAAKNNLYDLFDRTLGRIKCDFNKEIAEHQTVAVRTVMSEIMTLSLEVSFRRMPERKTPLVSVILPIYNAEKFLRQCLDSLQMQTLKRMEFVCVNDGSTDKSLSIIREYAKDDPRFIIIDKPNSGYGHTMNCGLGVAIGKYVGVVEPDDFVKPEMYERLVQAAENTGADFVKSGLFYHWSDRPDREIKITTDASLLDRILKPEVDKDIFNVVMNNVTGVYRRDLIEQNNIRFTETPGASYQDNSFYLQVHFLAKTAYLIGESFYYYRQDNTASSINSKGKVFAIFEEFRRNESLFEGRPKLRTKFYGQWVYKKYKSYRYHFSRIDEVSQIDFLKKMSEEFKVHSDKGEIDFSLLSSVQRDVLKKIITNWQEYYITQWRNKIDNERTRQIEVGKLKTEQLMKKIEDVQNKLNEQLKVVANLNSLNETLQRKVIQQSREITNLKRSESYKVGFVITWPFRKMHNLFK